MDYIPLTVTIVADISGYAEGDYCYLHSNGGSGDIDWDTAHDSRKFPLVSSEYDVDGWGDMPWGDGAWGDGYTELSVIVEIKTPGLWKFGLKAYDQYDNAHTGDPGEAEIYVDNVPVQASVLTIDSYDVVDDVLTVSV
ncbi:MAG: hypothetical protein JRL30_25690 [Deltaproteobacteria bacterium]|nr:hypothetical protein [Deltaproteobacteria bacterium]